MIPSLETLKIPFSSFMNFLFLIISKIQFKLVGLKTIVSILNSSFKIICSVSLFCPVKSPPNNLPILKFKPSEFIFSPRNFCLQ
jgi:hypothetical protein